MKVYQELQSEITNLTVKEFGDVQRIEGLILTEHKATGIEIAALKARLQHLNDTLIGILKPTGKFILICFLLYISRFFWG